MDKNKRMFSLLGLTIVCIVLAAVVTSIPDISSDFSSSSSSRNTSPTKSTIPTPKPINLIGRGQKVMTVDVPFSVSRVRFTNTGSDNFIVWMFAPDGSKELLVNTIGSYEGYRPLLAGKGKYSLEIEGTEWTATIESIPIKQFAYDSNSGIGDYVSPLFEPEDKRSVYEFVHNGDENFVVWLYCAGGTDLLQNDIGPVDNTAMVEFGEGPCLFDVTADGSWSIKREQ